MRDRSALQILAVGFRKKKNKYKTSPKILWSSYSWKEKKQSVQKYRGATVKKFLKLS